MLSILADLANFWGSEDGGPGQGERGKGGGGGPGVPQGEFEGF